MVLTETQTGRKQGVGFSLEQNIRRWKTHNPTSLDSDKPLTSTQDGEFRLEFIGLYTRKVHPQSLIDCRLQEGSPVLRMNINKFYFIYETCVAKEIRCTLRCSKCSTKVNPPQHDVEEDDTDTDRHVIMLQECPIAFRCVQATIDNDGVIVDLRYDIGEREVVNLDSSIHKIRYAVMEPKMLMCMMK